MSCIIMGSQRTITPTHEDLITGWWNEDGVHQDAILVLISLHSFFDHANSDGSKHTWPLALVHHQQCVLHCCQMSHLLPFQFLHDASIWWRAQQFSQQGLNFLQELTNKFWLKQHKSLAPWSSYTCSVACVGCPSVIAADKKDLYWMCSIRFMMDLASLAQVPYYNFSSLDNCQWHMINKTFETIIDTHDE